MEDGHRHAGQEPGPLAGAARGHRDHKVKWVWVKGHASHKDNNRCDKLAKAAARRSSKRG